MNRVQVSRANASTESGSFLQRNSSGPVQQVTFPGWPEGEVCVHDAMKGYGCQLCLLKGKTTRKRKR